RTCILPLQYSIASTIHCILKSYLYIYGRYMLKKQKDILPRVPPVFLLLLPFRLKMIIIRGCG
ncbi:MAG: hypothetical protein OET21_20765, partial [Desulfobacterales bacterium]|nr:hypothetical protein [Desulfobacterales bacterium]